MTTKYYCMNVHRV